jgi:hypothetical protein
VFLLVAEFGFCYYDGVSAVTTDISRFKLTGNACPVVFHVYNDYTSNNTGNVAQLFVFFSFEVGSSKTPLPYKMQVQKYLKKAILFAILFNDPILSGI